MTYSLPRTRLPVHGTTRYIRTELEVVDGTLMWDVPRTILGMIPAGTHSVEIPITEVEAVEMRRVVPHPFRILIGAAAIVVPWFFLPWWASVPLALIGLWTILIAFGPHLEVVTKDGKKHRSPICFGHSLDAELFKAAVDDMITGKPSP